MGTYSHYPATSAAVREAARKAGGAARAAQALMPSLAARHRVAAQEITLDLGETVRAPMADAGRLSQGGLWAACQLERFADAIDVYNHYSTHPRSIDALNAALADALSGEQPENPDAERRFAARLNEEKARLDAWLDEVATQAAAALDRPPSAAEVLAAWQAGNLPAAARLAWPDLNLGLGSIPAARLLADLRDPRTPAELREQIRAERPDVAHYETCNPYAGVFGHATGPDGRSYDVRVPAEIPISDYSVPHPSLQNDFISDRYDGEWRTVDTERSEAIVGSEWSVLAAAVSPLFKPGGWQSVGLDQSQYLTLRDGRAFLNETYDPGRSGRSRSPADPKPRSYDLPPPTKDYSNTDRPGGPYHDQPPGSPPPGPSTDKQGTKAPAADPLKRGTAATLILDSLQSLGSAHQVEANRHYTVETVYQEDALGNRRAVILMYQAVHKDGEVQINQYYGRLNEDGSVTPIT